MGKIVSILQSMGIQDIFDDKEGGILKQDVSVICDNCKRELLASADAVYRQHKRGKKKFMCKSCYGKKGWTPSKREQARNRTIRWWQQPEYAGVITGKAIAKEIVKEVENEEV